MSRLSQVIAVEKGVKSDAQRHFTDLHHLVQRPVPLAGIARVYQPKDDDGDQLPPESTQVQVRADDVLGQVNEILTRLFDVVATKDLTNCFAKAAVVVNGETILRDVPATTLLFLEKQLADLHTFVTKLPVLDPAEKWMFDPARNCHATEAAKTTRTKKVPRNHVLSEATEHHPAQVTVFNEDIIVGTWTTVKLSGALPASRVTELANRVTALREAVKHAREEANYTEVRDSKIGKQIFDHLFA